MHHIIKRTGDMLCGLAYSYTQDPPRESCVTIAIYAQLDPEEGWCPECIEAIDPLELLSVTSL